MSAVSTFISVAWVLFWIYWLVSAAGAKRGTRPGRTRPPGIAFAIIAFALLHVFRGDALDVHSAVLEAVGTVLFVAGLALAVWARIYLGRNWGMPMSEKDEPELVTSGPYQLVRHPIYSGILLAMLGTALAIAYYWLIAVAVIGAYFVYSARVEERIMSSSFPEAYPGYRMRTKMLIPFLL